LVEQDETRPPAERALHDVNTGSHKGPRATEVSNGGIDDTAKLIVVAGEDKVPGYSLGFVVVSRPAKRSQAR